jgi:site-specific DNA-adenine methylase
LVFRENYKLFKQQKIKSHQKLTAKSTRNKNITIKKQDSSKILQLTKMAKLVLAHPKYQITVI